MEKERDGPALAHEWGRGAIVLPGEIDRLPTRVDVPALTDGVGDLEPRVGQRLGDPVPQTAGGGRLAQLDDEPGEQRARPAGPEQAQATAAASAVSATAWPSHSRRSRSPLPTNPRWRLAANVAATRAR